MSPSPSSFLLLRSSCAKPPPCSSASTRILVLLVVLSAVLVARANAEIDLLNILTGGGGGRHLSSKRSKFGGAAANYQFLLSVPNPAQRSGRGGESSDYESGIREYHLRQARHHEELGRYHLERYLHHRRLVEEHFVQVDLEPQPVLLGAMEWIASTTTTTTITTKTTTTTSTSTTTRTTTAATITTTTTTAAVAEMPPSSTRSHSEVLVQSRNEALLSCSSFPCLLHKYDLLKTDKGYILNAEETVEGGGEGVAAADCPHFRAWIGRFHVVARGYGFEMVLQEGPAASDQPHQFRRLSPGDVFQFGNGNSTSSRSSSGIQEVDRVPSQSEKEVQALDGPADFDDYFGEYPETGEDRGGEAQVNSPIRDYLKAESPSLAASAIRPNLDQAPDEPAGGDDHNYFGGDEDYSDPPSAGDDRGDELRALLYDYDYYDDDEEKN